MESTVKISLLGFISVESGIVGVEYRNGNEREPSSFLRVSVESSIVGVGNSLVQLILLLVRAIDDVSVLELF